MTPNEHATAVAAASLGICVTCRIRDGHAPWCPVPHVDWADGSEVCDRCRHGLDAGEGYLTGPAEPLGAFTRSVGLECLPCALGAVA